MFEPGRLASTIEDPAAAQASSGGEQQAIAAARETIRECEAKMMRYRAAIDAGGDVQEITQWITAAKVDRL